MPYTLAQLVTLHKASLLDAAAFFTEAEDGAFKRHVGIAARDIAAHKRPRTLAGDLTLAGDRAIYDAPPDLIAVKIGDWGVQRQVQPWNFPRGPLPSLRTWQPLPDAPLQLMLSPAPSFAMIDFFGSRYPYYYMAAHLVPENGDTTITVHEVDLLLLRAKVEAMRELSIRSSQKPATLRGGQGMGDGGMSRNSTPAALYEAFLREYQAAA